MSVLDMFASALGAFILISVILFPYYDRWKQIEKTKKAVEQNEEKLVAAKAELQLKHSQSAAQQRELSRGAEFRTALTACKQSMSACEATLNKVFLVIGIEWERPCDVDLYVTDPRGREFSYRQQTNSGSKAELSIDMRFGPGVEVWQNPEAEVGDYKVRYQVGSGCPGLSGEGAEPHLKVQGWVLDRTAGLQPLPPRDMSARGVDAAVIHVSSDGAVQIR